VRVFASSYVKRTKRQKEMHLYAFGINYLVLFHLVAFMRGLCAGLKAQGLLLITHHEIYEVKFIHYSLSAASKGHEDKSPHL
jgi:hypothetical protein